MSFVHPGSELSVMLVGLGAGGTWGKRTVAVSTGGLSRGAAGGGGTSSSRVGVSEETGRTKRSTVTAAGRRGADGHRRAETWLMRVVETCHCEIERHVQL